MLRAVQYEEQVAANPLNYDAWFDYVKLEESLSGPDVVRGVYERAVENIPPLATKLHWCRYIYLWIYYAVYEELGVGDPGRAREVYRSCLKIIPHSDFTFAKIWILAAQLEVCGWGACFLSIGRRMHACATGDLGGCCLPLLRHPVLRTATLSGTRVPCAEECHLRCVVGVTVSLMLCCFSLPSIGRSPCHSFPAAQPGVRCL